MKNAFKALSTSLVVLLLTFAQGFAQEQSIGFVKISGGEAYVIEDAIRRPVAVGDHLKEGAIVETGRDGSIGVTMRDGTLLSIGPNSRFVIEEYTFEPTEAQYSLLTRVLRGTLVYFSGDIGRMSPENVRIETPLGIVGTRGTRVAVRMPVAANEQ